MTHNALIAPRVSAWLAVACLLLASAPTLLASSDLRLLIDVSGSMSQNDPANLRRPALRLVTDLLPDGNQAGVWLFADGPEPLVAPGPVDEVWKDQTRKRLGRIHSRGNFTDIESAIDTALEGWTEPPEPGTQRHLVLLTDGLVDVPAVAGGQDTDAASRARIMETTIARLQELGVKAHVVALSNQVDAPLVEALTERTGGWLEVAETDAGLQRAFLRMLEQSAPPTTVPIEGNRFTIDSAVREFTLLAFHPPGKPVSLVTPDGKTITAGRLPKNVTSQVSWESANEYDLVTVTAPDAGDWRLEGSLDPDNRVAVMTDLNIATDPIPNSIPSEARLRIRLWPTEQGEPIKLPDFLSLATARAEVESVDDAGVADPSSSAASDSGPGGAEPTLLSIGLPLDPNSATYNGELLPSTLEPGTYRFTAVLESATFTRQISRRLRVTGPPIQIIYQPQLPAEGDSTGAQLTVEVTCEPELVRAGTLFGYVRVTNAEGDTEVLEITPPASNVASYTVPIAQPGTYQASARVHAETAAGESLLLELPPETLEFDFEPSTPAEDQQAEESDGAISWTFLAAVVGGGSALFALIMGLVFWLTRTPSPSDADGEAKKSEKSRPAKGKRGDKQEQVES